MTTESIRNSWFRCLLRKVWALFALLIILAAVALGVARLLLPVAGEYRESIEHWASRSFGLPVKIAELGAAWRGFEPLLKLEDVQLLDQDGQQVLVRFDRAYIGVDLFDSIRYGEIRPGAITIVGVKLELIRNGDGTIAVRGIHVADKDSATSQKQGRAIENWLMQQRQLAIEASQIDWLDLQRDQRRWSFNDVHLRLRNSGSRHRLDGFASLPPALGRRIQFGADLTGNVIRSNYWRGEIYVQGAAVHLPSWLGKRAVLGARMTDGTTDFKLWSKWSDGKPLTVDGDVSAYFLKIVPAPDMNADPEDVAASSVTVDATPESTLSIDAVSARFTWLRNDTGWALGVERLLLKRGDEIWPPSTLRMAYKRSETDRIFQADLGFARVDDVASMLLTSSVLPGDISEALTHLQPSGTLRNLRVDYQTRGDLAPAISVQTDFDDLAIRPWRRIPGLSGLAGSVTTSEQTGFMEFRMRDASLGFERLFRAPLPVDTAEGRIEWLRADNEWRVKTGLVTVRNEDIRARGLMTLSVPDDGTSPTMNMLVDFEQGNGASVSRYLPAPIMPKASVDWLDHAIVNGRETFGGALFRGQLKDFPFDDGSGRFEVRFNVRDGILDYTPGWPRLEEIEAEVAFEGRSMKIVAEGGASFASTIEHAEVEIADLKAKDKELVITGRARGPTADALRYLRESPLDNKFGKYLAGARADGQSTLDLSLRIPLRHAAPRIDGKLGFEQSALYLADDSVDITNIDGALQFSEQGISAKNIHAQLLGMAATIDVGTDASIEPPVTRFSAHGNATTTQFAKAVNLPLVFDRVSGKTDWHAELEIAPRHAQAGEVTLTINSDLKGVDINFPEPLRKDADTVRDLRIVAGLSQAEGQPVRIFYGDQFNAAYTQRQGEKRLVPDKVELRFGRGVAVVPQTPGIHISGELERFALPEWKDIIDTGASGGGSGPKISAIDLVIKQAVMFDRQLDNVELSAVSEPRAWVASVKSRQMTGSVHYPHDLSAPLAMDLDYLQMEKFKTDAEKSPVDPRDLPVLRIRSKRFIYGETDWGGLDMVTSRRPDGLHIDQLKLDSPTAHVSVLGDWVVVRDRHSSSIDVKMDTSNLGQVLKNLDYAGGIADGKGHVELIAMWDGPLSGYALEKFNGTLRFNIENGRVLEIEPGAGRLFGLLSVQALPRRLSLDFSDLFEKGYGFDKMEGKFSINEGNAYTDNFHLDGPAARIEVKGRVGLAQRDYDQLVTVIPHVSSSLPVAGIIAGGPTLGAAMLLAEKLLKPGIEDIVTTQYSVKGSWSDPVIERLQRQGQSGQAERK